MVGERAGAPLRSAGSSTESEEGDRGGGGLRMEDV